ncbi:MAG: bacillithiol biosynthesis cysteine-adding enzyme BshC [Flavobacteriales bacterium]
MQPHCIPYAATRRFTPLVVDYLAQAEALRELYSFTPDLVGLRQAAEARNFDPASRLTLCTALAEQYQGMPLPDAVRDNLATLRRPDALTITTGHQLCLFGGPLYLTFKILNVVRLARSMSAELGRPVLPVFWMASEDHDRPEIDHTWINGTKVQWPGKAAGAVGHLRLHGIDAVLQQAVDALGPGPHAAEVRDLLYACYRSDRTLAEATRQFIHALFGRFGVLIVDGDDPALKQLFTPLMQEELLNQVAQRSVQYANERIAEQYKVQAFAREINLFHLRPGHRSRIVEEDGHYRVLDGGPSWNSEGLLAEVQAHPERFSPNVLMRPVYQETILPNIAYVGGGGELAYWLQLRWLFLGLRVAMPAVLLRTSAGFITPKALKQWKSMGLSTEELFAPLEELKAHVASRHASFITSVEEERIALASFYASLSAKAAAADSTLKASVEARAKAADKGLERIGKSLVRAAKRREHETLSRMDAVHSAVFPGGGLQERRDNILPLLAAHGEAFLDELLEKLDPLAQEFTLLEG